MPSRPFDCHASMRPQLTRRSLLSGAGAGLGLVALSGCDSGKKWHSIDVQGSSLPLEFTMTRAGDGKQVTQADYRGQIVMLYFGYTFCPDICPTTLTNVADVLKRLGPAARRVSVLFVTVDPNRDTPKVLVGYTQFFAPQVEGLRGTPDQLAALARRYRIAYSVTPATTGHEYEVTHSSAIYVFDGSGAARLVVPSFGTTTPDIAGTAADLQKLLDESNPPGLMARLRRLV